MLAKAIVVWVRAAHRVDSVLDLRLLGCGWAAAHADQGPSSGRALESAGTRGQLEEVLKSPDAKDVAIDLIAAENHIRRYLASRIYRLSIGRLARQPN